MSLTVKPLLETGVVLVLTTPTTDEPILLVGLVQGEVRCTTLCVWYLTSHTPAAVEGITVE